MKKLLITCTDLMMIQFLVPHVRYLSENGYRVEIACSNVGQRMDDVAQRLSDLPVRIHAVSLTRSPFSPTNLRGYREMKRLLSENTYDIIWTNEPVMGVVTRLAARKARKKGTKVLYMCHGFHFYKGAPKQNWLLYYPVERLLSRYCDAIVTINREDESRAKTFHCPLVTRIDGIGVDYSRLPRENTREQTRQALGISPEQIVLLSVGELKTHKNHQAALRAVAKLRDKSVLYLICGKGVLRPDLEDLVHTLGIEDQVHFLGYRSDIPMLMQAADIFVHPSKREGLGLACLEAMASGLPLVTSDIQGIPDYVENGVTGFSCRPDDVERYASHLRLLIDDKALREQMGTVNRQKSRKYAIQQIQGAVCHILDSL